MVLGKNARICNTPFSEIYNNNNVSSSDCGQSVWELFVPVERSVWLCLYGRACSVCTVGSVCRTASEERAPLVTTDCNMLTLSSRSVWSKDNQERAAVCGRFND